MAAKTTTVAPVHAPNLSAFYKYKLPPITPGDFEFLIDLLRQGLPDLSLDRMAQSLSWTDQGSALTGSVTLYRPDPANPLTLPIVRGDRIRCRVRWAGGVYELWTMRSDAPAIQVDQGTVQITLADDLILLDSNDLDWVFRKTKRRPYGYFCHEIAALVAKRLGLPTGELVKGTVRMSLVKRKASGKDVISQAYLNEKNASGRSFILRLRDGKVEVVTITRNPILYVLAGQIQTALIGQKGGSKSPTTALTGRAHIGHGKDTKKISYTAYDRSVISKLGYVPQTKDYGLVDSHAQLRADVTRDLAAGLRLPDTVTIDHAGIPFILRGDGVQIDLPAEGYSGKNSFAFATRCDHTVSAGVYTGEWDFNFTDPFLAEQQSEATAAAARAKKRAQRARPKVTATKAKKASG